MKAWPIQIHWTRAPARLIVASLLSAGVGGVLGAWLFGPGAPAWATAFAELETPRWNGAAFFRDVDASILLSLMALAVCLLAVLIALALGRAPDLAASAKADDRAMLDAAQRAFDHELAGVLSLFQDQITKNRGFSAKLQREGVTLAASRSAEEVREVVQALLASNAQMQHDNEAYERKLRESQAQIKALRADLDATQKISARDGLTNIFARRHFDTTLLHETKTAHAKNAALSLIIADIDHFKRINDLFGHPIGDEVLQKFATLLLENTNGADCVARYGGEEFAIILPEVSAAAAAALAERIRQKLESKRWATRNGREIGIVTASFGVAELAADDSPASLIERADCKLYQSKTAGRNLVSR